MEEMESTQAAGQHGVPGETKVRRAWTGIAVAAGSILAIRLAPFPVLQGPAGSALALSPLGKTSLAIVVAAVVLWVTEALPFPVTALIALLLLPAFGVTTSSDPKVSPVEDAVRNGLGKPVIVFLIGVLLLSTAFSKAGLGEQAVDWVLQRTGGRPRRVLLAILSIGMLLAAWITALAAVATMLPISLSILRRTGAGPGKSNFGRALMLATCMGPLIGGIAAPTGAAPNAIALDYLSRAGVDIRFWDWLAIGFPSAILLIPVAWLVLLLCFPFRKEQQQAIPIPDRRHVPLSWRQWCVLLILSLAILGWIVGPLVGTSSPSGFWRYPQWVGLLAGVLCFVPGLGVLKWQDAERGVPWRILLVVAAGLAIGNAFYSSHAADYVAWVLFAGVFRLAPALRFSAIVLTVAVLHLVLSSNTVTGSIVTPLLISIAGMLHISAWLLCAPAALTVPLALILPIESPDALIAYSSGYFSVKDMAKAGIPITLTAAVIIGLVLNVVITR